MFCKKQNYDELFFVWLTEGTIGADFHFINTQADLFRPGFRWVLTRQWLLKFFKHYGRPKIFNFKTNNQEPKNLIKTLLREAPVQIQIIVHEIINNCNPN